MAIQQRRWVRGEDGVEREAEWTIDAEVLAAAQRWARDGARLTREIDVMTELYPAWILTAASGEAIVGRAGTSDVAVPSEGAWRWSSDGRPVGTLPPPTRLAWQGLIPAPLAGLDGVARRLETRFPIEMIRGKPWTVVPVRVVYPDDFPLSQPAVFYDAAWMKALRLAVSSTIHVIGNHQLCLFYSGQWKRTYTIADVLSQRVVNHVYSVLKIANGQKAQDAFIGRIHDDAWSGERQK